MAVLRLLHYPPAPARAEAGPTRRRRAHRLWLRHAARDRWSRRAGGAHPRRRVAEGAACAGRLRLQHRRLPDALDKRHLCLDAASRGQPGRARALLDRLLPRSQSGSRHRLPAGLRDAERPARYAPIRGDAFLLSRLSPTYEKSGRWRGPRAGEAGMRTRAHPAHPFAGAAIARPVGGSRVASSVNSAYRTLPIRQVARALLFRKPTGWRCRSGSTSSRWSPP